MEQAHGTTTPGNTKPGVGLKTKSRKYFITFWIKNYPHELPPNCKYLCTCEDSTKDGKYHGHAFIYFINPVALSRVKKLFGNDCHVQQPMKNSDCINYVLNKNARKHDFQEFGNKPMDNGVTCKVAQLRECKDPDELDWNMYNTWKKIHDEENNDIDVDDWHKEIKVYYIQGPSGIGKTERAKNIIRENKKKYGTKFNRVKYENGFWIGTGTPEIKIAIYDDFRDSHMKASEFINFIDYNKQIMNVKGGSRQNNYNLIIITSTQRLNELYHNMADEPKKQWMRRIELIDMYAESDNDFDIDDMI